MFDAHRQGGDERWREYLGWGKDRHMVADLWDLTLAHAMAGAKEKPVPYPRPTAKPKPSQGIPFLQAIGRRKGE